jgi:hypothetical protein
MMTKLNKIESKIAAVETKVSTVWENWEIDWGQFITNLLPLEKDSLSAKMEYPVGKRLADPVEPHSNTLKEMKSILINLSDVTQKRNNNKIWSKT